MTSTPLRTIRLLLLLLLVLGLATGLAQGEPADSTRRTITIDGSGGTQRGNLRSGPIIYEHPDDYGIVATVATLTIRGHFAELSAPEGGSIAKGGERTASFGDGVLVERGRLSAEGPSLGYSEATGLGVLTGPAAITVAPGAERDAHGTDAPEGTGTAAAEGSGDQDRSAEEPVYIWADEVEFDVDTDRSTSSGNVRLVNGNQTAEAGILRYEEQRTLGVLTREGGQATITRLDDDGTEMIITADEIRVLTDSKTLYARGNVTVIDGEITSNGAEVFFDDATSIAEIIGSAAEPARAVDASSGSTLVTDRIKQDVEYGFFEAIDASVPSSFDATDFAQAEERGE